jgi:hypothetical protein
VKEAGRELASRYSRKQPGRQGTRTRATVGHWRQLKPLFSRSFKAHTGFEPVLPENTGSKPDSGNADQIAPGNELNPHLQGVLERLKERDRERER